MNLHLPLVQATDRVDELLMEISRGTNVPLADLVDVAADLVTQVRQLQGFDERVSTTSRTTLSRLDMPTMFMVARHSLPCEEVQDGTLRDLVSEKLDLLVCDRCLWLDEHHEPEQRTAAAEIREAHFRGGVEL